MTLLKTLLTLLKTLLNFWHIQVPHSKNVDNNFLFAFLVRGEMIDFSEQALDSQGTTAIELENAITQFEEGQEQCQKMGLSLLNALINYQSEQKGNKQWFYFYY